MSNRNNQINVPQAKQAMEQFKMQAAQEVGVNLQNGYNGHLTSCEPYADCAVHNLYHCLAVNHSVFVVTF